MGVGDPQYEPPIDIVDAEIVLKPNTCMVTYISASSDRPDPPLGQHARTTGTSLQWSTLATHSRSTHNLNFQLVCSQRDV